MKHYTVKPTKKQLEIMKQYWEKFNLEQSIFWNKTQEIQEAMSKETGIDNLEFFTCDGEWCGIGNVPRTMKLIQSDELEPTKERRLEMLKEGKPYTY